jgi:hypothetical protein
LRVTQDTFLKMEKLLEDHIDLDTVVSKAKGTISPWRYYILGTYSFMAAMQGLTWSGE